MSWRFMEEWREVSSMSSFVSGICSVINVLQHRKLNKKVTTNVTIQTKQWHDLKSLGAKHEDSTVL
jgi:hypothetical protein